MQGTEIEDEGSVLKYMAKSEIEEQHSSLLIMKQRLFSSFNQHDIGITCVNFGWDCLPILFPTLVIFFPRHGIFITKAWIFFLGMKIYFFGMKIYFLGMKKSV